ncbi:T9SS type A sorting domain-containing protein [Seonamhaeicola sp. ML3]|uniref:T9SS type A sorting domain-containing protein n=1 Tax=Seonamhaeicola sp. ML3 TaxID=2937786 RepID=UPI00200F7CCA|nr:T9SS type A sorting domain-containing protein [Seonamhaeicola sp. ML3]
MKKLYLSVIFILILLCNSSLSAQNFREQPSQEVIEELSIFPNPVIGSTFVTISSKKNLPKTITFFNVLGKEMYKTRLFGKRLEISNLNKGVYILKITEGSISETRKLVIK